MIIEIKSRQDGKILHSVEADTLKDAIVELVKFRADLSGANLYRAKLYRADLSGANLFGADLSGANLFGADLSGAKFNWQSHALISEILRRAAGDDVHKRMVAGLIAVSLDWCWDKFLAIENDLGDWALTELATWIQPDDYHPAELDAYIVKADEVTK